MTHYAFAASPFGNFAIYLNSEDQPMLVPIGELEAVPTKTGHDGTTAIAHSALTAEAHRQLEARGTMAHPHFNPRPEFTVNRVQYTCDLEIVTRTYANNSITYAVPWANIGHGMTDAARSKIEGWWLSVRESILTPEFAARTEYERALSEDYWARHKVDEERSTLAKAEAEADAAEARLEASMAALDALGR